MNDKDSKDRESQGMQPQKMLKPRGSEMLFSALFMRYFFKNLI